MTIDEFGPCTFCGKTIRAQHQICQHCVLDHNWRPTDFGYPLSILSARPTKEAK